MGYVVYELIDLQGRMKEEVARFDNLDEAIDDVALRYETHGQVTTILEED